MLLGAQITRETALARLQAKEASQGSPCQKAPEMNASLRWQHYPSVILSYWPDHQHQIQKFFISQPGNGSIQPNSLHSLPQMQMTAGTGQHHSIKQAKGKHPLDLMLVERQVAHVTVPELTDIRRSSSQACTELMQPILAKRHSLSPRAQSSTSPACI